MERPSNKQIGWGIVAVVAILATLFFGVNYPIPPAPAETPGLGALEGAITLGEDTRAGFRPVQIRALNVAQDMGVGGALSVTGNTTIGGAMDVTGWPSYGSADLRPIGNASNGNIIEFGATGAITQTVMTPVAISTVTAAGCSVNGPSAAAQLCYTSISGKTVTFRIYNAAATPAAISTPHANGASYWIGGQ